MLKFGPQELLLVVHSLTRHADQVRESDASKAAKLDALAKMIIEQLAEVSLP